MNFGPLREGIHTPEAVDLFQYIQHHTAERDVLIFQKPRVLTLLTGRKVGAYSPDADPQDLLTFFRDIDMTYLITSPFDSESLKETIHLYRDTFRLVHSNAVFTVYQYCAMSCH